MIGRLLLIKWKIIVAIANYDIKYSWFCFIISISFRFLFALLPVCVKNRHILNVSFFRVKI